LKFVAAGEVGWSGEKEFHFADHSAAASSCPICLISAERFPGRQDAQRLQG
jgi:hypothetical protein